MLARQSIRAVRIAARTSSSRPLIELSPRICKRSLASPTGSDGSGTTMPPDRQDTSENRRSFTTSKSWCYRLGPGNFQRILFDTPGLPVLRGTSAKAERAFSGMLDVACGAYPFGECSDGGMYSMCSQRGLSHPSLTPIRPRQSSSQHTPPRKSTHTYRPSWSPRKTGPTTHLSADRGRGRRRRVFLKLLFRRCRGSSWRFWQKE